MKLSIILRIIVKISNSLILEAILFVSHHRYFIDHTDWGQTTDPLSVPAAHQHKETMSANKLIGIIKIIKLLSKAVKKLQRQLDCIDFIISKIIVL